MKRRRGRRGRIRTGPRRIGERKGAKEATCHTTKRKELKHNQRTTFTNRTT